MFSMDKNCICGNFGHWHQQKSKSAKTKQSEIKYKPRIIKKCIKSPNIAQLNKNEILRGSGFGCELENIAQGRSYVDININISNCFFSRSSLYSGNGGVIYVSGGTYSMNINYSMFYKCISSPEGGAIFFSAPFSYLRMICANRCSVSSQSNPFIYYHFAYIRASQVNQVEYLSVSNCSQTTSGYYSIYLESGNQMVDNINSSMNNANQVSGIQIESPSFFTSSHCTFSNNKANYMCIRIKSDSETILMSYANIVHNNSPSNGVVFINGGSPKMNYCIFKNNQNILFCVWSGTLEVSHCFIYHSSSFSSSTTVSTERNNSFTYILTYQIQFFGSLYCNADMPLIDRTAMNYTFETPIKTPYETPMNTPQETIMNTLHETHINTPQETKMNTPHETHINTPQETRMNTPHETPIITPQETRMNTPHETPNITPHETKMDTLHETHINTPQEIRMNTLHETHINTPQETRMNTLHETHINTPQETKMNTLHGTPIITPQETRMNTLHETHINTPQETKMNTLHETHINTPQETKMNTLHGTPIITPQETRMNTLHETPMNSLDSYGLMGSIIREPKTLFAATFIIIIVVIVVIFYTKGMVFLDDSSSTLDSLKERTFWAPKI